MCALKIRRLIFGLIFSVVGFIVMVLLGQVTVLQCTHPEPSQVVCGREVKWLDVVPISVETIKDVRGAWVDERCDEDGCTYQVRMETGQGDVPLTGYYSSGQSSKEKAAAQINDYVAGRGGDTLAIREGFGMWGVLFGGIFVIAGLVVAVKRR